MYRMVTSEELRHHGIKGQKWGVRRFQEDSGKLTAAGKERYGTTKKPVANLYLPESTFDYVHNINHPHATGADYTVTHQPYSSTLTYHYHDKPNNHSSNNNLQLHSYSNKPNSHTHFGNQSIASAAASAAHSQQVTENMLEYLSNTEHYYDIDGDGNLDYYNDYQDVVDEYNKEHTIKKKLTKEQKKRNFRRNINRIKVKAKREIRSFVDKGKEFVHSLFN